MNINSAYLAAILAFSMWGLFPIYWKFFPEIKAWDLFAHRLVWSFLTLILILKFKGQLNSLKKIWVNKRTRYMLMVSALLISTNWLLYIYAISINQILEASMGYFLNPLINVFLGWLILKEKIRRGQWPAILLGIGAVIMIGFQSGITHFPWIALTLSLTFATYGLIRKLAHVGSLEGLAFETTFILLPTLIIWIFRPENPMTIFTVLPSWKIFILSLAGLITCAPLILFAYGAKRLPFGTLGFFGYLSPILKFVCGWLIFKEELGQDRIQAFILIWLALVWYSAESVLNRSKKTNEINGT